MIRSLTNARWTIRCRWKSATVDRFARDTSGAALLEFGLLLPLLFGSFMLLVETGQALNLRQDVAKKMRLGIEGLSRFDGDEVAAAAFANADGSLAFSGSTSAQANNAVVTIGTYYVCRTDQATTTFTAKADVTCKNFETWNSIAANKSSIGFFGTPYTISVTADLLAD